jgi:acyl-coenzyme A synthetase/AMP-(fatty) acid ligase
MSGAAARISPRYVRLSGEIADQAILDALRAAYSHARVAHAFASTEAGVAFEVQDGRAGFPAEWVGAASAPGAVAQLRIVDGSLQVRSAGSAAGYLGQGAAPLRDAEGYVDTGDRVQLRDGRYYFLGRGGGIINVGGLKVHPEEVEAVINAHPWVRLSRVRARRSPITGSIVAAEVVRAEQGPGIAPTDVELSAQLLECCRGTLAAHKVPAIVQFVPSLPLSAAGKLVRPDA